MDNLGDWLYIILLVIAGISGLLGAGKKKKQPTEVLKPSDYAAEPDSWYSADSDSWFEEVAPPPPPPPPKKHVGYTSLFKEGERAISSSPDFFSTQLEDSLYESDPLVSGDSLQDAGELKKAILYAEILSRKY
ncbi:MAG: hypothetical protein LBQ65_02870 [Tannerellaceae bacterium]|jgi:hypothetical protein|nr:hypothetical protein [Tannerellaceae bacterium]